ncbi:histidine phosphotransferase [Sphingomonas lacunae]|uniref:Histidine phosphotransferase n=1 Tax=Sphingomonas lacunae TaxID=2698828 RepID=A0A6M4AX93_9SPHN|nr:histidine phosphotransferase family protein [Sphingomonas lacunae]QJQ32972.1 histidine phosphotransferase [Sphingomonas lacunae]
MADDAIDFASMMVSRLCHDLLSPVGSFGNGLELLADEQDAEMQKRCIELLESSARVAINRLKYFRIAFGSAGGYGDAIAAADIREALLGLVPEGRAVELNWIGGESGVPKSAARLLLLFGMVTVDALVRGGRIDMAIESRGETLELAVRGSGDRLVIDTASEAHFAGGTEPLAPKTVPIELARRIARERGGDIMMSRPSPTELVVGAIIKAE